MHARRLIPFVIVLFVAFVIGLAGTVALSQAVAAKRAPASHEPDRGRDGLRSPALPAGTPVPQRPPTVEC